MILHVTRHGQVDQATDHPVGDPYLSEVGCEQARLLGERLKGQGFNGSIYSSPFLRTVETAQIVAEVVDAEVIPAAEIREYVIREGQMDQFRGATAVELRDRYSRVPDSSELEYPWWTSEIETDDDIEARVSPLINEAVAGNMDALLVGHGASVGGVHRHILKRHAPDRLNHGLRGWNCVLSSFGFGPFEIVRLLDTDHLPDDLVTSNAQTREEVLKEFAEGRGPDI